MISHLLADIDLTATEEEIIGNLVLDEVLEDLQEEIIIEEVLEEPQEDPLLNETILENNVEIATHTILKYVSVVKTMKKNQKNGTFPVSFATVPGRKS